MATNNFKPALIIVDLQEDFCPPVRLSFLFGFLPLTTNRTVHLQ
jgi:nicotinamidase-related amidase